MLVYNKLQSNFSQTHIIYIIFKCTQTKDKVHHNFILQKINQCGLHKYKHLMETCISKILSTWTTKCMIKEIIGFYHCDNLTKPEKFSMLIYILMNLYS